MSSAKEIKDHLKDSIDKLSASDARQAAKDLDAYFDYLQARREMPKNAKLNFTQFQELLLSIKQGEKGKVIPAHQVFTQIRRKYGLGN